MALTQKRLVEVNEKQEASNKLLYILAKKELENMKGKERTETEEALKQMEEK